ncbi:hypothetical protein [Arsenicicoccus sp. oral taxon 190]|uniref:hypothetical protein n=1 Tax=Arsenicicoccus sp. oral taxon 190 TaxID=1658671 RepID=UPI00067A4366|nr:hypothetical protein [Arsenicicoccus sp. oral taxon 190]AKT51690.1 hypothetical protein ADJ73_11060 [Arsenicicoccus sp. oral taxon 190]
MFTRTSILEGDSPLASAIPRSAFTEHHDTVVAAPPTRVWDALMTTRWADLALARPLFAIRSLGRLELANTLVTDPRGPGRPIHVDPPHYYSSGMVGRPWEPRADAQRPIESLDQLREFAEPGWLRYGMDFRLTPLPGSRTHLETTTRCDPTDEVARRRFRAYWAVIRPFSGLLRRDLLRAIRTRAEHGG